MMDEGCEKETSQSNFDRWVRSLEGQAELVDLWHEAMAQLRHLNTDAWNGVKFFLTVNGFIIAGIFTLWQQGNSATKITSIILLALVGLVLSIIGGRVYYGQRRHYVRMLLRKTLLEAKLGFYDAKLDGVDMVYPWGVEARFLGNVRKNPREWAKWQIWRGQITPYIWITLLLMVVGYALVVWWVLCWRRQIPGG